MGGYLQKTRPAAKPQTSADTQGIDARSATPDGSGGQSPARSLLQLRQALDDSPRVRQHAALQRALDQRAAAPAKKKSKEKPALQRKGIAINDDVGLEREADVMGARARAMPQAEANAASTPASRAGAWAATIQRLGNETTYKLQVWIKKKEKEIHLFANETGAGPVLKQGLKREDLEKLILPLNESITAREEIAAEYEELDEIDPGDHKTRVENEKRLQNEVNALLNPESDTNAKLYVRDEQINDTDLNAGVSYENVKLYCSNKNNEQAKRLGLAKAWNKGRSDNQFIDTNAILLEKNAPASKPAGGAGGGGQNSDTKAKTNTPAAPSKAGGGGQNADTKKSVPAAPLKAGGAGQNADKKDTKSADPSKDRKK
jgi:hypothetical protein